MMEQAVRAQAEAAKEASYALAVLRSDVRDAALHAMATALTEHAAEILQENAADVADAEAAGVRASYIDRLGGGTTLFAVRMVWRFTVFAYRSGLSV